LAVLGPALAVGLADLLRERRDTPRTNPFADPAPAAAPTTTADRVFAPAAPPAAVTSADEAAASAALASLLGVGPSLAPRPSVVERAAVLAPAAAAPAASAARVSGGRRRRTVQRVIVRKLAMRDGRVLAESTVERQVPLFGDEAEIDARVQAATDEAAHAALLDLMRRVPEDAVPAIRDQLRSLERVAVGSR
jgi:hypothetical protein